MYKKYVYCTAYTPLDGEYWNQLSFHGEMQNQFLIERLAIHPDRAGHFCLLLHWPEWPQSSTAWRDPQKISQNASTSLIHLLKVMAIMVFDLKRCPTKCLSQLHWVGLPIISDPGQREGEGRKFISGCFKSVQIQFEHLKYISGLVVSTHLKNISQIGHLSLNRDEHRNI